MKLQRMVQGVVVGALLVVPLAGAQQVVPDALAVAAERSWLALVDSGYYGASWDAAAPFFQAQVDRAGWARSVEAVRGPLGKVMSRTLEQVVAAKTLPGAPDGTYAVAVYATTFEHKQDAVETVTCVEGVDGRWRVTGYFVK